MTTKPAPGRLKRLVRDLLLAVAVVSAVSWWQTRDLLPAAAPAPALIEPYLDAAEPAAPFDLSAFSDKTVLLYFFAPWCGVCKLSAGNLHHLRRLTSADDTAVVAVALDYESAADVRAFVRDAGLDVPVVMGDAKVRDAFKITAYPSYYVLAKGGVIAHASVGYSTLFGLWWRTWWAH
jgi:thiol-disulfide isomerase/thioredoxin